MTEKRYDNGKLAKWYYCQTNTICDGTNQYYLGSKEPTPDFDKKVLLGTNQLLDLLNEQDKEIKEISDSLDNMVDFKNKYRDKYKQLKKEKEQLKKQIERIDFILDDLNGQEYISRDDAINGLNKIDKAIK